MKYKDNIILEPDRNDCAHLVVKLSSGSLSVPDIFLMKIVQ